MSSSPLPERPISRRLVISHVLWSNVMEPTAPDRPISKFLQERGEGIHHIAITADDIEKDVARATGNGMRMLGNLRTGSYGRRITFIHPKSLHGVLTEFCEAPPAENGKEE